MVFCVLVVVKGEKVRSKSDGTYAAQAKTIRLGLEEGEAVAVAVILSKIVLVYGYLLEYMFEPLVLYHHLVH